MAEADKTGMAMYDLTPAAGRGPKIFGAVLTLDDSDTVDTGLGTVESISITEVEASDGDGNSPMAYFDELTAGILTIQIADIATYTDQSSEVIHIMVVGSVR